MSPQIYEQLELFPDYLGSHIALTLSALAVGILVSVPLALIATRVKKLEWPVLAVAGILQTIPSLALLALMVPLLGQIGFVPAFLALILYSMLPILRNTVTGINEVDPALIEAARAIGMTDRQMLFRVQLPLAAPVIIAGVRISTVWVVGIATLSTPVGAASLGNYIFSGLQTQNYAAVMVGVVGAALLALFLDGMIRLLEIAVARRRWVYGLTAAAGLALLIAAPAISELQTNSSDRPVITLGSKTFTEQYILMSLFEDRLQEAGFAVQDIRSLGSTVIFDALRNNRIDCYVDYSGTIWANHMQREDNPGREAVLEEMTRWLKSEHGIDCLGSLGFENAYVLAMPEARSSRLGIRTLTDLAGYAPSMSIGGDYEFFSRPEWEAVRSAYDLNFQESRSFDSSLMYSAVQQNHVDVIAAFSTDGRILAYQLQTLEDTREALPPYDAVILLSPEASGNAALVNALTPLLDSISNEEMRNANKLVDLDGSTIQEAALTLAE